jgi:organic radical activating enzyme
MKKKLRLLLVEECNRRCKGCVNTMHDLDILPVVKSFKGYNEIILTGGEPMMYPALIVQTIQKIRKQNLNCKVYLNTAKVDEVRDILRVWGFLDGITVTLHVDKDFKTFQDTVKWMESYRITRSKISKRLNVVSDVLTRMSWEQIRWLKKSGWQIKSKMWMDDCPLPEGEVFMRLKAPKAKLTFGGTG